MRLLKRLTYRPAFRQPLAAHQAHFVTIACLASRARIWHLQRPRSRISLAALAEFLEAALAGGSVPATGD
jgi:hypothetical protein